MKRFLFYRILLPLNLPWLNADQKWICCALGISHTAYRIRAFEGVHVTKWTQRDKLNPGIDLDEALVNIKKHMAFPGEPTEWIFDFGINIEKIVENLAETERQAKHELG